LITLGHTGHTDRGGDAGGLMIQGCVPGANLFTDQATITYSFIFGFLLASILMLPVGMVMCRYVANVWQDSLGS
jgi:putative tricarboxylic transport membrane protein